MSMPPLRCGPAYNAAGAAPGDQKIAAPHKLTLNFPLKTMKLWLGLMVSLWLICGLIGAWWLDEFEVKYWRVVAKGPISLARAYNENPPDFLGPN
jgi:hypothetical protein